MNATLSDIVDRNTLAVILVAILAFAGQANGTIAVLTIGLIQIVDLPALVGVICQEAREGC
ncbi:hypothetical protein EXE42_14625 [Halorubrum sp. SP3]|uniref:hypothetical protein n=1 Tax=Halorubrum sp. SP3 TaxID=1537265 RepID=UPI0010F6D766|nr:hypothetical protein [Halorubrum sp. SP3]TKX53015.1 hypothetical protein EXE42_14625 [Halorubrum sp. SP3]